MHEKIREGFDVFVEGSAKSFGAVRQVRKTELVVYVENAGDFEVPLSAVKDAEAEKVILDQAHLSPKLKEAIHRAHAGEDPRIP
jgi:hypothetical protein